MTAKPHDEFDPRFDPAFQRGFTGERVRPASPRPPADPSPTPPAPQQIGLPPAVDAAAVGSPAQIADAAADEDRPRRLNPFLAALAVVSVALVAVGLWVIRLTRAPFEGGNAAANVDFVLLQVLGGLAPAAIALGVATAIGIVFVYAVDWQKRH